MGYVGRPGPSPVLAAYFAAGLVRAGDRVLDLGCGEGMDAVALARWGCRDVTGVDRDPAALATARRRAAGARMRHRVRFVEADALDLGAHFPEGAFDVAWDGLLLNNLRRAEEGRYARSVARAVRPGGLLLLQFRVTRGSWESWASEAAGRRLRRWFRFGPPANTLIPEHPVPRGVPPWARVVTQVGERNPRRT